MEVEWAPSLEDYVAESNEMGPVAPTVEDSTAVETLTAEEVNTYFAETDAEGEGDGTTGGTITIGTGTGGQQNAPPEIVSMSVQNQGDTLLIWGQVTDDQNPAGYLVTFSGLISATVRTDEYGYFQLEIPKPITSGEIIAVATDSNGSNSQEFSYYYDAE